MSFSLLLWNKIKNIPTQPCCGYFLHGGTRVVGLLDFGLSLFATIFIASEIYQSFYKLQTLYQNKEYFKYYFRAASWASYFTYKTILLGLSILLFKAAKKRSSKLCKIWMGFSVSTNVALLSTYLVNNYLFSISKTAHVFVVFYIIYKLYCLHVVWSFVKEIESYGGFNAALSGLTDAEVEEFEKGCPPDLQKNESDLTVENQGFNKDFEIRTENLEIDQSCLLGSGAFGCVYRGKFTSESGKKSVAVKTVNPNADVAYFKTLLSELKVMTFVSHHENVVGLVGACTAGIKEKKLYVVVEFCPFGNLHEFLKARRGLFVNYVKNGEIRSDFGKTGKPAYANLNSGNTVTTMDLFKWMHDSSKGLEFLSEQKKVIHGDIAARNILLAYGKIAKISQYIILNVAIETKTLHKLIAVTKIPLLLTVCGTDNAQYLLYKTIKKLSSLPLYFVVSTVLLPWRWLALKNMEFSTKSDVWSFGTAIWEVFSLSELPFPGFSWDKDFVTKVSNGLRMNQPKNATNEIYQLMVKCWQPDPNDRPTFKEVRQELEDMLNSVLSTIGDDHLQQENQRNANNGEADEGDLEDEVEVYIPNQVISDSLEYNN